MGIELGIQGLRVVLGDDHLPMRHEVKVVLQGVGCDVVQEAGNGQDALDAAVQLHPDLCILNVRMPGDGIVAAEQITGSVPGTVVVMYTASQEDEVLVRSLRADARGVVSKDVGAAQLPRQVQRVLDGDVTIPPTLVRQMAGRLDRATRRPRWRGRAGGAEVQGSPERRVLDGLEEGQTIAGVAMATGMSHDRVRETIVRLLDPLV